MLRDALAQALTQALTECQADLNLPDIGAALDYLNIERPRQESFGDLAVNVSPLARIARQAPPQIAQRIAQSPALAAWQPSVAAGFINVWLPEAELQQAFQGLLIQSEPGKNTQFSTMAVLMEFVSANPTGPLHIGHGRWLALGDSLGRLMRHCGAHVTNEFYVNDAGSQMRNIANSVWYRCLELLGTGGQLPAPVEGEKYAFYAAEYVVEIAQAFLDTHRDAVLAWDNPTHKAPPEALDALSEFCRETMLAKQKALMARCGLEFQVWTSEKALHAAGSVVAMVKRLKAAGVTYEQEGALWFASSRFGDDQDRVLVKSDGSYTYLTADIAYHEDKMRRDGAKFTHLINIWGADHHGYIPRMRAAMIALGHDPERLEIILGQLVNLMIDGERTRMGKRKKMLTLEDLVDEVGVDAVRFWMVSKSQDTALDFNVDLAASSSDENPVFYAQYAHARCCSILRNAFEPRLDTVNQETLPPLLDEAEWHAFRQALPTDAVAQLFAGLENAQAPQALKVLLQQLDHFEARLLDAVRLRAPHVIARYILDLAADFHHFYAVCRVLTPDPTAARLRLLIIWATQATLAQALALLGVSAPDHM